MKRSNSPYINHFISPDTIVPGFANPQNLNRYSYVSNNPLKYTDPTGHMQQVDDGGSCSNNALCLPQSSNNPSSGGGGPHDDDDLPDPNPNGLVTNTNGSGQDCSWSGIFGGAGCNPQYYSLALGLDAPSLIVLAGLGISIFAPEAGVPIILSGAAFEACAFTASPLCAAVKLASANIVGTVDKDGNFYLGPQLSWGKSILPVGSVSLNAGMYPTADGHIATEAELEDSLQGFSASAGTIATGGVSYSPFATENNTGYYLVGVPEVFSINLQYNWLVFDFSP